MNKVLITGGAGFIGFHLARALLREKDEIHLVDNFARGVHDSGLENLLSGTKVTLLNCDLLKTAAMDSLASDYDYIYHLAAIIGVKHVMERPYAVLSDNFIMLKNVIDFAKSQQDLQRFVFASTSEVYAGTLKHFKLPVPTPESTPLALLDLNHNRTSYMLSKIYGEAMCQHSGLNFTIIRPHNFFGPRMGMSHVVPELLKRAYNTNDGGVLEVYSIDHKRSFCYIDDAVEFIRNAAEKDSCVGETLNLGNQDAEISMRVLAEIILEVTGKRLEIKPLPDPAGSPKRRCPDMKKTISLTGYRAKVSIVEGVRRTFDWYRKNVFEGEELCEK